MVGKTNAILYKPKVLTVHSTFDAEVVNFIKCIPVIN